MNRTVFDKLDSNRFVISGTVKDRRVFIDEEEIENIFERPHTWIWGPAADLFILRHLAYRIMKLSRLPEKVANHMRDEFCERYLISLPFEDFSFTFNKRAFLKENIILEYAYQILPSDEGAYITSFDYHILREICVDDSF